MIPGGRVSPRQLQLMMKRLGMTTEPLEGVEEVVIRTKREEHRFRAPEVTILTVQGVRTYQVVGEPTVGPPRGGAAEASAAAATAPAAPAPGPPEEDVELVMSQADVDRETAVRALEGAHGAPAEAILALLSRRGR